LIGSYLLSFGSCIEAVVAEVGVGCGAEYDGDDMLNRNRYMVQE